MISQATATGQAFNIWLAQIRAYAPQFAPAYADQSYFQGTALTPGLAAAARNAVSQSNAGAAILPAVPPGAGTGTGAKSAPRAGWMKLALALVVIFLIWKLFKGRS
jgi:hypothetical protein